MSSTELKSKDSAVLQLATLGSLTDKAYEKRTKWIEEIRIFGSTIERERELKKVEDELSDIVNQMKVVMSEANKNGWVIHHPWVLAFQIAGVL